MEVEENKTQEQSSDKKDSTQAYSRPTGNYQREYSSNTALSRQFIRTVDASADVHIQSHCADMEEGKNP